ncbi:MAG TPA: hypothetical protein VG937_21250 [Polyangiaceae bacterium]|nr:hypothetical protein [Polyangiaceae bacterium]
MTARRSSFARVGLAVGLVLAACSGAARVPPGLPPPEYEQPGASPWPPADAGVVPLGDGAAQAEEAPAPPPAVPGAAGAPGE